MTYENYIKALLLDYALCEAWHERSPDVVLAVAQVIANRVKAGWHGGDWLQAITDAPNRCATTAPFRRPSINPREPAFRQMLMDIDAIYHGSADDSSINPEDLEGVPQTSLYYADLGSVPNIWFKENIASNPAEHPRLAKVGSFTFFG